MRTDDLIRALAADGAAPPVPLRQTFAAALIPGVAITLIFLLTCLGPRPHLLALIGDPRLTFKLCITLLLSVLSGKLVTRIARPGATLRSIILMLGIVPVLLIAAGIVELCAVPHALWGQRLIGSNAIHCLKSIPFLAAVPLVSVLLALRQGAPEHPAWAGAAAGLFAGAVGAAFYATHCPDDSPLFVAAWYTLAIVFVTAIGALGGARVLRW